MNFSVYCLGAGSGSKIIASAVNLCYRSFEQILSAGSSSSFVYLVAKRDNLFTGVLSKYCAS